MDFCTSKSFQIKFISQTIFFLKLRKPFVLFLAVKILHFVNDFSLIFIISPVLSLIKFVFLVLVYYTAESRIFVFRKINFATYLWTKE